MATLDSIADEIGYSRNELMQSMVKFGLTNRDWRNEGLTAHKRLPRYEENPMATKPPSPAQLAARERFAEMARSGSLNRKRQIASKQKSAGVKRNPTKRAPAIKWGSYGDDPKTKHAFVDGAEVIIFPIKKSETDFYDMPEWTRAIVEIFPDANHDNSQYPVGSIQNGKDNVHGFVADSKKRSSNPAKKTVSQKISQLVHEGYPQKQAVAVALNEQRAGKVKRNPSKTMKPKKISYESSLNRGVLKSYVVRDMEKNNDIAEFMSKSDAMKYARDYSDRHDVQVSVRSV